VPIAFRHDEAQRSATDIRLSAAGTGGRLQIQKGSSGRPWLRNTGVRDGQSRLRRIISFLVGIFVGGQRRDASAARSCHFGSSQ
jgi:hypothetical protein